MTQFTDEINSLINKTPAEALTPTLPNADGPAPETIKTTLKDLMEIMSGVNLTPAADYLTPERKAFLQSEAEIGTPLLLEFVKWQLKNELALKQIQSAQGSNGPTVSHAFDHLQVIYNADMYDLGDLRIANLRNSFIIDKYLASYQDLATKINSMYGTLNGRLIIIYSKSQFEELCRENHIDCLNSINATGVSIDLNKFRALKQETL